MLAKNYDLQPIGMKAAMQAADRLIGFYPRSAASDPQVFMAGLVDLLASYSKTAVDAALSVRSGIPAKYEMMPALSKIREFLEAEDIWLSRQIERQKLPQLPAPPAEPRPTIDDLKAKYGPNWGLKTANAGKPRPLNLDEIAAKYGVSREQIDAIPDLDIGVGEKRNVGRRTQ